MIGDNLISQTLQRQKILFNLIFGAQLASRVPLIFLARVQLTYPQNRYDHIEVNERVLDQV